MNPIHLHLHTSGSVLDGAINIDLLFNYIKLQGNNSVAITDHGNMIKTYEFYTKAKNNGINPILGCEFYISDGNNNFHLILLAKNKIGFDNLLMLRYKSNFNFYYKPRITFEDLVLHKEGLICLSACVGNEIHHYYKLNKINEAKSICQKYLDLFGEDYYLEIQSNRLEVQKPYNLFIQSVSKELNIETVVTCDAHYLKKEHYSSHDTLLCISTKAKKNEQKRFRFTSNDFYVQDSNDIYDRLSYLDKEFLDNCITNTHKVAEKCNVDLETKEVFAPKFNCENEKLLLAKKCNIGYKKRLKEGAFENLELKEVVKRISYELDVICSRGYAGYFLIVQDFIEFCISNNIYFGVGRGSVCGSEIAFILGITEVEPMTNGLLFERFLNPTRNSFPDIDLDFCYFRRSEVIEYLINKYGKENVCHIMAEGTFSLKAVVRRVLSAYSYDQKITSKISKILDNFNSTKDALKDNEFSSRITEGIKEDIVNIEGLMSHVSKHAAGLVISPNEVYKHLPVSLDRDSGMLVSEWHKKTIEKINLIKFDILGLKHLTIFDLALKYINENGTILTRNDVNNINYEDKKVFEMLQNSKCLLGVFQFAGKTAGQIVTKMKVNCFEDVMVANSICRTGVKDDELYLENKESYLKTGTFNKPSYWKYVEDILSPTYGAIVYQEQTMLIMNKITGGKWDLGKCDSMRKVQDLEEFREGFLNCSIIPREEANKIFDRFNLEYSFNKAHACGYGKISYQSAWFLAYHSKEYISACMTLELTQEEPNIQGFIKLANSFDINVLSPNINSSTNEFLPVEEGILMPLTSISNVGDKAVKTIMSKRPFLSFDDFLEKVPKKQVNKRAIINLIKAGTFDCFNENRTIVLTNFLNSIKETSNLLFWSDETQMLYEREVFGFSLEKHPLDNHINIDFHSLKNGEVSINCIVNTLTPHVDKNGNLMCFVTLENKKCIVNATCFSETYKTYYSLITPFVPILVTGKKDGDSFIIHKVRLA